MSRSGLHLDLQSTPKAALLVAVFLLFALLPWPAHAHMYWDMPAGCWFLHNEESFMGRERQRNAPAGVDMFWTESFNHVRHENCYVIHVHYVDIYEGAATWGGGIWNRDDVNRGAVCGLKESSPNAWNPDHSYVCELVWNRMWRNTTWSSGNNIEAFSNRKAGWVGLGAHFDLDWAVAIAIGSSGENKADCWRLQSNGTWYAADCQL